MNTTDSDTPIIPQLKEYSFITYAFERFFRLLQFLPPQLFFGNRSDLIKKRILERKEHDIAFTIERSRKIETLVTACVVIEFLLIPAIIYIPSLNWLWLILATLRIIDIIQVTVNMNIFDHLRVYHKMLMASTLRTLVLSILNYGELILCFGLIYLANLSGLKNAGFWTDSFYFSTITQLTIGYGDIQPAGWLKLISALQGLIGLLFTIFILGRFVSMLPPIEPVIPAASDSKQSSK